MKNFWRAFSGAPWQLAALPYSRAQQILAFIQLWIVPVWEGHISQYWTNWKASNILNWLCQNISFRYSAKIKCLHINRLSWLKKKSQKTKQATTLWLVWLQYNVIMSELPVSLSLLFIYRACLLIRSHIFKSLSPLSENDSLGGVTAARHNW